MRLKYLSLASVVFAQLAFAGENLNLSQMSKKIETNDYKQMTGVVVSKNNQIVFEEYYNGGGVDAKNDMRSASKSLTSLALGFAIQEGFIKGVEQPVLPYFKDKMPIQNADPRKTAMNLEDLLTMSSPLECDDWNDASRGYEERMYIIEDWTRFILDLPIKGTPPWKKTAEYSKYGRAFSYCTGGVQVLADVVERVTKTPMSTYLQTKLFNPLGIEAPVFSQSPLGVTNGGGGMKMTSRDWIKIGQLMMNEGMFNKKKLISANWVKESFKRRAVIDETRSIEYGYLWWINEFTVSGKQIVAYAAAGNGGNYMFMIPSLNAQVVITSQAYNTSYMHKQSQEILTDHVIPALMN